jgi:hypothetical protein
MGKRRMSQCAKVHGRLERRTEEAQGCASAVPGNLKLLKTTQIIQLVCNTQINVAHVFFEALNYMGKYWSFKGSANLKCINKLNWNLM